MPVQKKIIFISIIYFINLEASSWSLFNESIIGTWKKSDGTELNIEIRKRSNDSYYGFISNPENDSSENLIVMDKLIYNTSKKNFEGIIIPPNKGIEIPVKIELLKPDLMRITMSKLMFTKTIIMIRK